MAGQLVGEVNCAGSALRAAGVPFRAAWMLGVIAERCHAANRQGCAPVAFLAGATYCSPRTVSRILAQLVQLGLITVIARGGGRGRRGMPAVYRLADIARWLIDHGQAPPVVDEWALAAGPADDDGEWIGRTPPQAPDPVATPGASIPASGASIPDPPAIQHPSTRHPDVVLAVVPGASPGETPQETTGPHEVDRRATQHRPPRTAGWKPSPRPRPATTPAPGPAEPHVGTPPSGPPGSICGSPSCRHPLPCWACGQAKASSEERERTERRAAQLEQQDRTHRRAAEKAAAIAGCHRCDAAGYHRNGFRWQVCRHIDPPASLPGRDEARAVLASISRRVHTKRAARAPHQTHPGRRAAPAVVDAPTQPLPRVVAS